MKIKKDHQKIVFSSTNAPVSLITRTGYYYFLFFKINISKTKAIRHNPITESIIFWTNIESIFKIRVIISVNRIRKKNNRNIFWFFERLETGSKKVFINFIKILLFTSNLYNPLYLKNFYNLSFYLTNYWYFFFNYPASYFKYISSQYCVWSKHFHDFV